MSNRSAAVVMGVVFLVVSGVGGVALADSHGDDVHKLAIQVNSNDKKTLTIALNNAKNVIKHYGVGFVEVEIVGYGPGLELFLKDSPFRERL